MSNEPEIKTIQVQKATPEALKPYGDILGYDEGIFVIGSRSVYPDQIRPRGVSNLAVYSQSDIHITIVRDAALKFHGISYWYDWVCFYALLVIASTVYGDCILGYFLDCEHQETIHFYTRCCVRAVTLEKIRHPVFCARMYIRHVPN